MTLLQNRSQRASFLVKHIGATGTAADAGHLRSVLGVRNVSLLLQFTAPSFDKTSSTPVGYTPGSAIFPPMKSGGMGVGLGYIEGSGTVTNADLINALRLIVASLVGAGSITSADGRPALPGVASLTGAGDVTDAALLLILNALADLVGAGDITSAGASGSLSAVAALVGAGTVAANLNAIAELLADLAGTGAVSGDIINIIRLLVASLVGSGTISGAVPYAIGSVSADLTATGDVLDTSNVGAAVWAAIAAANNIAGTMGQALNAAGSAGDPWITTLPGAYTGAQAGALLDAINTLVDELHRIHGLNASAPLEVTDTTREVGAITQTIVEAPVGTVTVSRT